MKEQVGLDHIVVYVCIYSIAQTGASRPKGDTLSLRFLLRLADSIPSIFLLSSIVTMPFFRTTTLTVAVPSSPTEFFRPISY